MSAKYVNDMGVEAKKKFEESLKLIQKSYDNNQENITEYRNAVSFNLVTQYSDVERQDFSKNSKVTFEFNLLYTYIRNIIGEQLQNTPEILARPRMVESDKANELSELVEGIIRYICYNSNAAKVNQNTAKCQFIGGYGAFFVMTDYEDEESFNLGLSIKQLNDATDAYFDYRAQGENKEDGAYCGFHYCMDRDEFKATYNIDNPISITSGDMSEQLGSYYAEENSVIIANHWEKEQYYKTLVQLSDGTSLWLEEVEPYLQHFRDRVVAFEISKINSSEGDLPQEQQAQPIQNNGIDQESADGEEGDDSNNNQNQDFNFSENQDLKEPVEVKRRRVKCTRIWYMKMIQNALLEKREWPSVYLPVVYVPGDDFYIQGIRRTKSATKYARDSQRFLNYTLSTMAESMKQTRREQWIASKANMEGADLQEMWRRPDQQQGVLLYEADPITGTKPERVMVGELPQSWIETNQVLQSLLQNIIGRSEASMGENGPNESGKSIQNKMIQSSLGAYTYIDNNCNAWRHLGRILVDMIPRVYDTERFVNIITRDNQQKMVQINKLKQDGFYVEPEYENEISKEMKLDVEISIGRSSEIQKQEALETLIRVSEIPSNPKTDCILDKIAELLNIDNAKEIRDRWVEFAMPPSVKAEITGKQAPPAPPNPQMQMMQMEMQAKQGELQNNLQKTALEKQKLELQYQQMIQQSEQKKAEDEIALQKLQVESQLAGVQLHNQALRSATDLVATHHKAYTDHLQHGHNMDKALMTATQTLMGNAAHQQQRANEKQSRD